MNTIIAYQPNNTCFLFKKWKPYPIKSASAIYYSNPLDGPDALYSNRGIVAKWIIRLKQ